MEFSSHILSTIRQLYQKNTVGNTVGIEKQFENGVNRGGFVQTNTLMILFIKKQKFAAMWFNDGQDNVYNPAVLL